MALAEQEIRPAHNDRPQRTLNEVLEDIQPHAHARIQTIVEATGSGYVINKSTVTIAKRDLARAAEGDETLRIRQIQNARAVIGIFESLDPERQATIMGSGTATGILIDSTHNAETISYTGVIYKAEPKA